MKTSNEKSEMPIKAIKPGKRIAKLKLVSPFDSISDLTLHYLGEYLENLITLQGLAFDFDSCQKITNKGLSNLCKGLKTPLLEKASDRLFQVLKYDYGCVWYSRRIFEEPDYLKSNTYQFSRIGPVGVCTTIFSQQEMVSAWKKDWRSRKDPQIFDELPPFKELLFQVTDVRLESFSQGLKKLFSLQELFLGFYSCVISDTGLLSLTRCLEKLALLKSIRINFKRCEYVTFKGVVQARKCLDRYFPGAEIIIAKMDN